MNDDEQKGHTICMLGWDISGTLHDKDKNGGWCLFDFRHISHIYQPSALVPAISRSSLVLRSSTIVVNHSLTSLSSAHCKQLCRANGKMANTPYRILYEYTQTHISACVIPVCLGPTQTDDGSCLQRHHKYISTALGLLRRSIARDITLQGLQL